MATRLKDSGTPHSWVRVAVIVVLMLGLTSLIVSALISGHRSAAQQSSDSLNPPPAQDQLSNSGFITSATGISPSEVSLKSRNVQSSSTTLGKGSSAPKASTAKSSVSSTTAKKSVKTQAKLVSKATTAKPVAKKVQATSKKPAKPSAQSSASSDELFPELRKH